MDALSVHPLWKSDNHTGRSRGGENNNGVTDHSKTDKGEPVLPVMDGEEESAEQAGEPVNVIYQTAEDGLGDTIKPRLLAAGADCSKVLVIDDSEQPLTMLDERLEQAIQQTNARLVVLDPIQSFLGTEVDMHRANEIRPLMKRVSVLAENITVRLS